MQRSLNAGVYRYELIASRDGTHVMVIAANGHNKFDKVPANWHFVVVYP